MAGPELSRRGFLFGITAAGAFAALPLPDVLRLASSIEESVTLGQPFAGEMAIRLVGPITLSEKPIDGYLPLDWSQIEGVGSVMPEIDINNLHSTAREFSLGLADPGAIRISGMISPEMVQKFEDGEMLHSAIQVRSLSGGESRCFSFQCYISELRSVGTDLS